MNKIIVGKMSKIFKYKSNQPFVWFHRQLKKSNQYCLYCASYIGPNSKIESNKEHLIARQFIPSDYMKATDFNFIFRSCTSCNNKKSSIERHLSTTTLFNSDSRFTNDFINTLALNKASKDYHPDHKGQLVLDSDIQQSYEINSSGVNTRFRLDFPPQSTEDYVRELAFRHIQGLFSLFTSDNPLVAEGTSILSATHTHFLGIYPKNDWGNNQIKYCISKTQDWLLACNISIAGGHFKALLLKSEERSEGWFWALEWNKSLRILGTLINEEYLPSVYADFPELNWSPWIKNANKESRLRKLVPLDSQDTLFRENSD